MWKCHTVPLGAGTAANRKEQAGRSLSCGVDWGTVIKEQARSNVGEGRGIIPYSPVHLTAGEMSSYGGCLSEAACGSISALGGLPASRPCPVHRQHPVCLLQR